MKGLFILFVSFIAVNALDDEFIEKFMEKMQKVAEICVEETGANDEDLAELIAKKIPPTSHEARCMIFCINKKFGIQKEDGKLDKIGAILALDDLKAADFELYKQVMEVAILCGDQAKIMDDPCETATGIAACLKIEAKKAGLDDSLLA